MRLTQWLRGKEPICNGGDARYASSLPVLGRSPGEGNGYPPQYSCLENPTDKGARQAPVKRVARSQTQLKHICTQCISKIVVIGERKRKEELLFF